MSTEAALAQAYLAIPDAPAVPTPRGGLVQAFLHAPAPSGGAQAAVVQAFLLAPVGEGHPGNTGHYGLIGGNWTVVKQYQLRAGSWQ